MRIEQPSNELRTGDDGDGTRQAIASRPDADPRPHRAPRARSRARLEPRVRELGRRIAAGQARAGRSRARALEDRGMELLSRDPALKAALFRLVDVAPACSGPRDVAAHLASLLGEVERPLAPVRRAGAAPGASGPDRGGGSRCTGWRKRFIVGEAPADAVDGAARPVGVRRRRLGRPARRGDRHRRRGRPLRAPLRRGAAHARDRAARGRAPVERDAHGAIPRVNLSVKVTALTARVRAEAPELGIEDAAHRLRGLLRTAKDGRRAPARRHGVDGLARPDHRARAQAAGRAGVQRRPARRDRPAGLPARRRRAARPAARRRRRVAADDPAGQGRLLGARDGRGAPARLDAAGVRAEGRERPQLRAADADG